MLIIEFQIYTLSIPLVLVFVITLVLLIKRVTAFLFAQGSLKYAVAKTCDFIYLWQKSSIKHLARKKKVQNLYDWAKTLKSCKKMTSTYIRFLSDFVTAERRYSVWISKFCIESYIIIYFCECSRFIAKKNYQL